MNIPELGTRTTLERNVALLLTLVVVVLHVYSMERAGGLWRDEVNSVHFATMSSYAEIWKNLEYDNFPPFFLAPLRFWSAVGLARTDFGYRVLGLFIGLGILAVFWLNGRWLGCSSPLVCLSLMGMNPLVIRVGDSMRPYGLGMVLIGLMFGLVWKLSQRATPGRVCGATILAVLSVQCLYQNAFLLFSISIAGFVVALLRGRIIEFVMIGLVGFVAALTLLVHYSHLVSARAWLDVTLAPITWPQLWIALQEALGAAWPPFVFVWLAVVLSALGFFGAFLRQYRKTKRLPADDVIIYGAVALISSIGVFFVFLRLLGMTIRPWYFLILMVPVVLSLDCIRGSLFARSGHLIGILVTCVLIALASVPGTWSGIQVRNTNLDWVAQRLEKLAAPDDLIIVNPWYCGLTFGRYFKGSTSWLPLPPLEDMRIHRYDLFKRRMMMSDQNEPVRPLLQAIQRTLNRGQTLWLVGNLDRLPPGRRPPQIPPAPHEPGGLRNWFFSDVWSMNVAYFIQSHAQMAIEVPVNTAQPVSEFENLPLILIRGWRE